MDSDKKNEELSNHCSTETEILERIRKERYDVIKMQVDLKSIMTYSQEFVQKYGASNKNQSEKLEQLKTDNANLKEQISNELIMFSNLKTDIENLVGSKAKMSEVIQQLNEAAKAIEANGTQLKATNDSFKSEILEKIKSREAKEQFYIKEVEELQSQIEKLTSRNQQFKQECEISLNKQDEEIKVFDREKFILVETLQDKKYKNENQKRELKKSIDKRNDLKNEYSNLHETVLDFTKNQENNQLKLQKEIEVLEEKIKENKNRIFQAQNEIEMSQIEHTNLNEETLKIQEDIQKLESVQNEKEDLLFNLETEIKETQIKVIENRNETSSKLVSLKEKLDMTEERNKNIIEDFNNNKQSLEDSKIRLNYLKENLFKKNEDKKSVAEKLENAIQKGKEFSLTIKQKSTEYKEKINELKLQNDEKGNSIKVLKEEIDKKTQNVENIKTAIQNCQIRKKSLDVKKEALKEIQNEVKELKKKIGRLEYDEKTKKSTREKKNQSVKKSLETKVIKMGNEIEKFKEKMDVELKDRKDNFLAEKRKLEITNKTLNSKINSLQKKKGDLNTNISELIQTITDISNKSEMSSNIKTESIVASQNLATPRNSATMQNTTISTSQLKNKNVFSSKPNNRIENKLGNASKLLSWFSSENDTENEVKLQNIPTQQIKFDSNTKTRVFDQLFSQMEMTQGKSPIVTSSFDQTEFLEKNMSFLKENYMQRHPEASKVKNVHLWTTDTENSDNNFSENINKRSINNAIESEDSDFSFKKNKKINLEISSSRNKGDAYMDKLFESLK